ncbi:Hypothetical predicted protein [Podarcis lilfordi]|uniref:Uncharacterized protein n=1 Tax=Podarcis lilfordi TaxID=74358 RepID=A0AA35L9W1_9SAUR|nr:Hypothetical predicted protein [Podarcis lilfordi]
MAILFKRLALWKDKVLVFMKGASRRNSQQRQSSSPCLGQPSLGWRATPPCLRRRGGQRSRCPAGQAGRQATRGDSLLGDRPRSVIHLFGINTLNIASLC